jgi:low affinity Fe/Cu permease
VPKPSHSKSASPPNAPSPRLSGLHNLFSGLARYASTLVAHPISFLLALLSVLVWAAAGPALHYSENWQLVINTSTTILTFLMVFLLQNMQNRDSRAMQVKLDELLRAVKGARTELVDLENVTEEELARYCDEFKTLHLHYTKLLATRGGKIAMETPEMEIEVTAKKSSAITKAKVREKTTAKN